MEGTLYRCLTDHDGLGLGSAEPYIELKPPLNEVHGQFKLLFGQNLGLTLREPQIVKVRAAFAS